MKKLALKKETVALLDSEKSRVRGGVVFTSNQCVETNAPNRICLETYGVQCYPPLSCGEGRQGCDSTLYQTHYDCPVLSGGEQSGCCPIMPSLACPPIEAVTLENC